MTAARTLAPGYTQRRLAQLLGVSERTVRTWLASTGTGRAMPETARRLILLITRAPGLVVPMLEEIIAEKSAVRRTIELDPAGIMGR